MHRLAVLGALLAALPAQAQNADHIPTIADCPPGYTLGIQESDQPQLFAAGPDYEPPKTSQEAAYIAAQAAAAAPRAFITGCVPPQRRENQ